MYHFSIQATDALVAAIDFNDDILITGFEDALIAMWTLNDASELGQVSGHTGGITGNFPFFTSLVFKVWNKACISNSHLFTLKHLSSKCQ